MIRVFRVVAVLALAAGGIALVIGRGTARSQELPGVIRSTRFELVDDNGHVVGVMGTVGATKSAFLEIRSSPLLSETAYSGSVRITMDRGPVIQMYDPDDIQRIRIGFGYATGGPTPEGKSRYAILAPRIELFDEKGEPGMWLGWGPAGRPQLRASEPGREFMRTWPPEK